MIQLLVKYKHKNIYKMEMNIKHVENSELENFSDLLYYTWYISLSANPKIQIQIVVPISRDIQNTKQNLHRTLRLLVMTVTKRD